MIRVVAANHSHRDACIAISKEVVFRPDADPSAGFLVTALDNEKFAYFMEHGLIRVAEIDEQVAGFLIAYARGSQPFEILRPDLEKVVWLDQGILAMEKLYYVHHKATAPNFRRQGVARALYANLLADFPDWGFLGATVEKPILNSASHAVRQKLGFRKVGTFRAPDWFGFKDYESGIYLLQNSAIS